MTDDTDDFEEIPAAFSRELTDAEMLGILRRNGLLTRAQSIRVWQMRGEPIQSGRLRIYFLREEVMRLVRQSRH